MALDWTRGYSAEWRVFRVNKDTWADGAAVPGVDSAEVNRTDSALLESGTLSLTEGASESFQEQYLRIVMYAEQGGDVERVDMATLLCASSSGEYARGAKTATVDGRSVLYPAATRRMLAGSYAPSGSDGAEYAADLLRDALDAPVANDGGFTLDADVVFKASDSYLDAAWNVLKAGNHVIQLDGDGTVHVRATPTEAALPLDAAHASLLMPGIGYELDYSGVPNRYVAVEGGQTAEAVNDDAASPTSTESRGYYSDVVDESPTRVNGETLASYAERRLAEESTVRDTRSYTREWWPGVTVYDVVGGSLPSVGIDGDMRVASQSLRCGKGVTVVEKSYKEVSTWPA